MTRFYNTILFLSLASTPVQGFIPSLQFQHGQRLQTSLFESTETKPFFVDAKDDGSSVRQDNIAAVQEEMAAPKKNAAQQAAKTPAKKSAAASASAAASHKEGIFSPFVYLGKKVLGEEELNRIRGKAIALHSDTIKSFVSTAETTTIGSRVLEALYKLADQNGNGKIEMNELEKALQTAGFRFLGDKQIKGIFKRAGGEEKGFITLEEWLAEAPKTLKTNLVKLAKTNGGELGFLV